MGTVLHREAIVDLVRGINMAARVGQQPDEPSQWRALTQLEYVGCKRPDGSMYRTYPDVFVFRHAIDPLRGLFTLEIDGPPVLIIEVASESTFRVDTDLERGKGYCYARVGTPVYVVIDPTHVLLHEGILGWRLAGDRYRSWVPAADGLLHSEQIPIAIGLEGARTRVYLSDGRAMPREEDIAEILAQRDEALAQRDEALAREHEELERLRRLLAERDDIPS